MTVPVFDGWERTPSDDYDLYCFNVRVNASLYRYERAQHAIHAFFVEGVCEHAWLETDGRMVMDSDDIAELIETVLP